jgi:uncharacterized protein (DUF2141 family)
MKKIFLLGGMMCVCVCALCQTKLQVTVTHIAGQKGDIIVGVFDSDENFLKKPIDRKVMKPSGDSITVVFENLKPGKYAVCVIHDANKNKELDQNKLAYPKKDSDFQIMCWAQWVRLLLNALNSILLQITKIWTLILK